MNGVIGVGGKKVGIGNEAVKAIQTVILPPPNTELGKRTLKIKAALSAITTGRASVALMMRAFEGLDRADATNLEKGEFAGIVGRLKNVETKLNERLLDLVKVGAANR